MYANTDTLAAEAYRKCFPDGYEIIPTPGIGLYCGFAAVIKTMETMHPDIPLPTIEELLEIFNTEDVQEEIAPFLLDNVNNFTADEVGLVLRLWGECFFLNLRLGYIVGDAAYLVPQDGEAIIIWIHNDNAEALDGCVGHWSGVSAWSSISPHQ